MLPGRRVDVDRRLRRPSLAIRARIGEPRMHALDQAAAWPRPAPGATAAPPARQGTGRGAGRPRAPGTRVDRLQDRRPFSVRCSACVRRSRDDGRRSTQPRASIRSTSATIRELPAGRCRARPLAATRPRPARRTGTASPRAAPARARRAARDQTREEWPPSCDRRKAAPGRRSRDEEVSLTSAKPNRARRVPLSARRPARPRPG